MPVPAASPTPVSVPPDVPVSAPPPMLEWHGSGNTSAVIRVADFERLIESPGKQSPDLYLNDTLVSFFLEYEWTALNPTKRARTYIFNSFFYKHLSKGKVDGQEWPAFTKVERWTDKVKIFDMEMLFVPINEKLHWFVAVILNPGAILRKKSLAGSPDSVKVAGNSATSPRSTPADLNVEDALIITLDSLGGLHSTVAETLNKWLVFEARDKEQETNLQTSDWNLNFPAAYRAVDVPGQNTNMTAAHTPYTTPFS